MPTLHSIHRCGAITHVALPKFYNIPEDRKSSGSVVKTYSLSSQAKRKIKSSLQKMWYEKSNKITFWTFTYKLTDATRPVVCDQKILNSFFSTLLENTKKTYGLSSYIWVSERTKAGAIHYHCVFDIPKLAKTDGKKSIRAFFKYHRDSFRDFLACNGIHVENDVDYCSVGFPSKRDRDGNYRGSVVRNVQSLSVYLAGYLQKCSRVEEGGRIYAISRNVLERPVKAFQYAIELRPDKTIEFEYCSVDYFKLSKGYDDFFLKEQEEEKNAIVTESDLARESKTYDRKWKKKHMKIAENLQIPYNFYMKYYRNAESVTFLQYFSVLTESQYHNLPEISQLTQKSPPLPNKYQEKIDFDCHNVIPF